VIEIHVCLICCRALYERWQVCGPACYMQLVELQLDVVPVLTEVVEISEDNEHGLRHATV
jgi:hypothetical protein